jgi:hypothetical protein
VQGEGTKIYRRPSLKIILAGLREGDAKRTKDGPDVANECEITSSGTEGSAATRTNHNPVLFQIFFLHKGT